MRPLVRQPSEEELHIISQYVAIYVKKFQHKLKIQDYQREDVQQDLIISILSTLHLFDKSKSKFSTWIHNCCSRNTRDIKCNNSYVMKISAYSMRRITDDSDLYKMDMPEEDIECEEDDIYRIIEDSEDYMDLDEYFGMR